MPLLLGSGISVLKAKLSENFYDLLGTLEWSVAIFLLQKTQPGMNWCLVSNFA